MKRIFLEEQYLEETRNCGVMGFTVALSRGGVGARLRFFRFDGALALVLLLATLCLAGRETSAQGQELFVANKSADFHDTVLRYSITGTLLGNLGVGAPLSGPVGLAFDAAGNLYVANQDNNTILRYSSSGAYLGVFASSGLSGPCAVAFDRDGTLIVCNYWDRSLSRYSASGALLSHIATGIIDPCAIALDGSSNIYVSMANQGPGTGVFRFAPDGTQKTLFASGATLDPRGMGFDNHGNLYVVNCFDDTVRRFASDGTDLGVFASTGLNNPFALTFDAAGEVYVSNQTGGGIRRFSPTGTDLGTFAVVTVSPANPVGLAFSPVPEPGCLSLLTLGGWIFWGNARKGRLLRRGRSRRLDKSRSQLERGQGIRE